MWIDQQPSQLRSSTTRQPHRRAARREQVLRRRPRAARRRPRAARRRGPRADGRERRRQVDAREGPRRRRPARRRRDARRRRRRSTSTPRTTRATPGIAVIYQEPTLFPDLSVAENVVMGYHPLGALRRIDRGAMHRSVQGLLDRLGVRLDPERPVRGLSIADQQIVEIAKALSFDARVLIMDEPTAALSGPEVERLFTVVRTLREEGAAVLFISHRLDEVFAICDTVTVMRDGAVVHDAPIADMTPDEMVRRMVGRELSALFPKQDAEVGDDRAERAPAHARGRVLRRQLRGARGRDRRARRARRRRAAARSRGRSSGSTSRTPATSRSTAGGSPPAGRWRRCAPGIGFVPEDRRQQGLVMDLSIARNATMTRTGALRALRPHPPRRRERARARVGDAAAAQVPPARRPGRLPLGRQPAEGRARQVARHRAEAADPRRADARHRRRHQGRGPPADERARRPRASRC